jgi:hypothetical protein
MREAEDICAGRVYSKAYRSVEEMNADLDAMDDEEGGEC